MTRGCEHGIPFTEEVLHYQVAEFPFAPLIHKVLMATSEQLLDDKEAVTAFEQLHYFPGKVRVRHVPLFNHDELRDCYHRFIRDFVRPHLEEEFVIFERNPNLRVHYAGAKSLTKPHKDSDHQHSQCEINFWLPLTTAKGVASLWAESVPGRGDFHSFDVEYGQLMRFYGNGCLHFTKDNNSNISRVSFDFRVVRLRDFPASGIPLTGTSTEARWCLFSYYDVMGPQGLVGWRAWDGVLAAFQSSIVTPPPHRVDAPDTALPGEDNVREPANQSCTPRARSSSSDHVRQCTSSWGSARVARQNCARCGWIANRESLRQSLTYVDERGIRVPWIEENLDGRAPWGLGCRPCRLARTRGFVSLREERRADRSVLEDYIARDEGHDFAVSLAEKF